MSRKNGERYAGLQEGGMAERVVKGCKNGKIISLHITSRSCRVNPIDI
jgi:hypothetical protein